MISELPWLMLIISLPGQNPSARMRIWRALKAGGAGAVRDGVYLLPQSVAAQVLFAQQATEVNKIGGTAHLVPLAAADAAQEGTFLALFDRSADYASLMATLDEFLGELDAATEPNARRRLAGLRREWASIVAVDFFPSASRQHVETALADAEVRLNNRFSPDEPQSREGGVPRRDHADYRGRRWATRAGLWVDRVASAWLIVRFIDPQATFCWLKATKDCPKQAIGFDFDGAQFTHIGDRVTFEVLMASFGLEANRSLAKIAALVHYLDVGGVAVPEAAGFTAILAGARARLPDDDALLAAMGAVLDDLYAAYADPSLTDRPGRAL